MREKMRSFFRQMIYPFIITALLCFALEILVAMIPRAAIQESSEKSALYFKTQGSYPEVWPGKINTRKSYYADIILCNVIYGLDEKKPASSVLRAEYYDGKDTNPPVDYMTAVLGGREPNTIYFRYWHGSMVWLKPLLCITDITGIYRLYTILIWGGVTATATWLAGHKKWKVAAGLAAAFLIAGGGMMPGCLEYGNIMLLTLAMIPCFLWKGGKDEDRLLRLCVVNGVLTCFVNFLATETLAITLPLGLLLLVQCDENGKIYKKNSKESMWVVIKALFCWGISYAGMFLVKWILATLTIGRESMQDSLIRTKAHLQGNPLQAIYKNVDMLFPWAEDCAGWIQTAFCAGYLLLLGLTAFYLLKRRNMALMVLLFIPYLRYVAVSSHSFLHCFFTYRAQMITVMGIVYVGINWIKDRYEIQIKSK